MVDRGIYSILLGKVERGVILRLGAPKGANTVLLFICHINIKKYIYLFCVESFNISTPLEFDQNHNLTPCLTAALQFLSMYWSIIPQIS